MNNKGLNYENFPFYVKYKESSIFYMKGDEPVLKKYVNNNRFPKFQINKEHQRNAWKNFVNLIESTSNQLSEKAVNTNYAEDVRLWTLWIQKNCISQYEEIFINKIDKEDSQLIDIINKILIKYCERIGILLNDLETYEDYGVVIQYLQEMPHEILNKIDYLIGQNTYCCNLFDSEIEIDENLEFSGSSRQENFSYTSNEDVEKENSTSFYFAS